MNWKFKIKKPEAGTPLNWEIYFPPGLATWASEKTKQLLSEIKLPNQPEPKLRTFTEKIKLENTNSHQIAYLFQYGYFLRDIRLVVGKTEDWNHFSSHAPVELPKVIENSVPIVRNLFQDPDKFLHSEIISFLHGSYFEKEITVTLSLFGESSYIRGGKPQFSTSAPVPEDLAASLLLQGKEFGSWEGTDPAFLYLPFAGTGTFSTEWELEGSDTDRLRFPRSFVFPFLKFFPEKTISHFQKQRQSSPKGKNTHLWLDTDPSLKAYWQKEKTRWEKIFGRNLDWSFETEDFFLYSPLKQVIRQKETFFSSKENSSRPKLFFYMPLNPPYGFRKKEIQGEDHLLYPKIADRIIQLGEEFQSHCRKEKIDLSFSGFLLCPSEEKWMSVRNKLRNFRQKTIHVTHGGIDLRVLFFDLK